MEDKHPDYYGGADNPYEAIKVIEANGWMEGFCLGNVYKYIARQGEKTPDAVKDLKKARDYIDFYIDFLTRTDQYVPITLKEARDNLNIYITNLERVK